MSREADEDEVAVAGELRLTDPEVRASRPPADRLLDPEFVGVGASGRRWAREGLPAARPDLGGGAAHGPRYEPSDISGVVPAPGLVHLTYETVTGGRRARRSSLWRRSDGGWRMYYQQATPVPPGTD